jgi:hypothetical protein
MAGPWEKYQSQPPAEPEGPWTKYKAQAHESEGPGVGTSLARGAVQNLTLGLADESYGLTQGVRSLLSGGTFSEGYNRGLEEYRANDKSAREANPIASTVGEVAGSIVPMVAAGGTALGARALGLTGPNLLSRSAASAGSGGAIGAVQGFNSGEGDAESRARNAVAPLATGVALGAASPTIGLGVGKAVNAATRAIRGGGTAPSNMTGAAADLLADDFARAGGARAITQRLDELGPEAMLLDASPSLMGRAQGLAIQPETREGIVAPLMARNRGANVRLNADVDAAIGPAPVPSQIEAGLAASRDATAEAYGPVMRGARATDTRTLADNLEEAAVNLRGPAQRAVLEVRRMLDIPGNPGQLDPSPQALHSVREAIDGLMENEANSRVIRQLTMARRQVDEALARAAPGIKDVDARYAELARQSEGLERGARVLDSGRTAVRPSELATEIAEGALPQGAQVGPSAAPFRMRQGLRADIDREIGNRANDLEALKKVIKGEGDWNREKLALVFGQDEANAIIGSVDREAAFRNAYNKIVENSQTAQRTAGAKGVEIPDGSGGGASDAGTVLSGAVGGAPGVAASLGIRGLRLAGNEAQRAAAMARNEGLMRALTTQQGPQLDALVRGIERRLGILSVAGSAEERARALATIITQSQGDQGSRALPESLRPAR